MISVSGLAFRYADSPFELRIDELSIEQSDCVAVVGPSGSGKTTLLNLLSGIFEPNHGTITIGDKQVTGLSDSQRRDFRIANVGFVFQDFELIEYLDVRENILLPCFINASLPLTNELSERAAQLAESLGVGDKLSRPVERLSQGERQRVAICRALLTKPKVLLADEPTGNLDPSNKDHIISLLTDYARSENATLVVVTHDHSLLSKFDRTVDFAELLTTAVTT